MRLDRETKKSFFSYKRGLSIIEAIFGVFVLIITFYSFFGLLNSVISATGQNKARLGAMSLAEEQIEYMRSLPFASVGVVSGNPSGNIPAVESITLNGIQYTRRNSVSWVDDPKDGVAPSDAISTDYKQVKIEVSWTFRGQSRKFFAATNIAPKGLETNQPGGIFKITVADAAGAPVQGANINIKNPGTGLDVNRITPNGGIWYEYGLTPATGYEITVTKSGYNVSRTYGTSEVANPDPGHLTSIDDEINAKTFFIDRVSGDSFFVFNPPAAGSWDDSFADAGKLQAMSSTTVSSDSLKLEQDGGLYKTPGYATSTWIAPPSVFQWKRFSWNDAEPAGTELRYRLYYNNGGVAALIGDAELPGNSAGLSVSPVDLSGLNNGAYGSAGYSAILIAVFASTTDSLITPSVQDWTVVYEDHVPQANFVFNLRGAKTIGTDAGGAPVYKYSQNLTTDAMGFAATSSLEWDTYAAGKSGYDIAGSCPPQPQYLAPNTNAEIFIDITLSAPNAILVHAKTSGGADIPGALVRLYRAAPAFDQTKKTELRCGQAFWNNLAEGTAANGDSYTIDVSAPPHTSTTTILNVDVFGYSYFPAVAN